MSILLLPVAASAKKRNKVAHDCEAGCFADNTISGLTLLATAAAPEVHDSSWLPCQWNDCQHPSRHVQQHHLHPNSKLQELRLTCARSASTAAAHTPDYASLGATKKYQCPSRH